MSGKILSSIRRFIAKRKLLKDTRRLGWEVMEYDRENNSIITKSPHTGHLYIRFFDQATRTLHTEAISKPAKYI